MLLNVHVVALILSIYFGFSVTFESQSGQKAVFMLSTNFEIFGHDSEKFKITEKKSKIHLK